MPAPASASAARSRVWELRAFGADHLTPAERPRPEPGPRDLLIRVKAVSLNYRDLRVADGTFFPDLALPALLASDAAGEVVAIGADVTRFAVGDRVMTHYIPRWIDDPGDSPEGDYVSLGVPLQGVLTEHLVLHEESVVATPAYLDDREASTLPIAALTAWSALIEHGPILPGQTLLVEGTGGVSLFALQIGTALGARVIVTSSSDEKLARAKALGAWETINYTRHPDWEREARALTGGRGVNRIVEVVGGDNVRRAVDALARNGHIALVGLMESTTLTADIARLLHERASIRGVLVGSRKAFERMNRALETLRIRPVVDRVYPFADTPAAFAHLARGPFGKVVIDVAS